MLKSKLFYGFILSSIFFFVYQGVGDVKIESKAAVMSATTTSKPITFTDDNFSESISEGVVLVDFWAPWCGPCRRQGPILEEIAKEHGGKITIGKLNIDNNKGSASKYYVRSIPTMIIFKNGKVEERLVGLHSKDQLMKTLRRYL